ncbi:MAG: argininosuccinate synthase domain-containing protein [Lentimicrobiaceae bacterium]|jgi:argininosuccinate synthase
MIKEKAVLAFSGGLDTSFCTRYLTNDKGFDVHTAIVNTGGFSEKELEAIQKRAIQLGATSHVTLNIEDEYYQKCIRYMIYGNMLKNGTYPLSVSSERTFQALAIAQYVLEIGAKYVVHGSTGAGNDQVRFDLVFNIIAPEIEIITPIRDLQLSREAEIEYLKKQGFEADWKKLEYSINKGLWGTSVGGKETLTSHLPLPETAYPSQLKKNGEEILTLTFEKGEVTQVNGISYSRTDAIRKIEAIASEYAVGRDMHIGDTIIGIKGRVGFEAAAPMIIIKAHHALEKHVLTKWQQYWKEQLSNWYGMLLHEGQYLDPVMRNIEKFLDDSQETVSGEVYVKLNPYRFNIDGIKSDFDMMNAGFGQYGEMNDGWSANDVKGFTKILGNQLKIHRFVQDKNKKA